MGSLYYDGTQYDNITILNPHITDKFMKINIANSVHGACSNIQTNDFKKVLVTNVTRKSSFICTRKKGKPLAFLTPFNLPNFSVIYDNEMGFVGKRTVSYSDVTQLMDLSGIENGTILRVGVCYKRDSSEPCYVVKRKGTTNISSVGLLLNNGESDEFVFDFEKTEDFDNVCITMFASDRNNLLKYAYVSELVDISDEISKYENLPKFLSAKPTFTPKERMIIYSKDGSKTWIYNGEAWVEH